MGFSGKKNPTDFHSINKKINTVVRIWIEITHFISVVELKNKHRHLHECKKKKNAKFDPGGF